jgi:aldose 1-epimerase
VKAEGENSVTLTYTSHHGDEGFPGNLVADVSYTLTDAGELQLEYRAVTDQPTVVNLTGHAYWNLAGEGEGNILDSKLLIDADFFVPADSSSIPTGEIRAVKGTPFDFTTMTKIGERLYANDEQIKLANGYDRCWALRKKQIGDLTRAALVRQPDNGRALEVWTTEPGVQFYSGNFLDGKTAAKGGRAYPQYSGFCLETQHFPDSPNHAHFPSTVLRPGQEYRSTTIYKISTT